MSDKQRGLILACVFILPAIYFFQDAIFHEHTRECVISSHQNREGEPSGGNPRPSKSDCVKNDIFIGSCAAFFGVGFFINAMRKKD